MTVYEDDEIDLRPYLQALIRKWWVILLCGALGAGIGLIISKVRPERYEATAVILLTKQTSRLTLTSQFPTTTEASDIRTRADTILTIAESDAVAEQVMQAVRDRWPANGELTLDKLKNILEIQSKGDTLLLTVSAEDADLAQAVANTWAQTIIDTVNPAYSGEQPLSLIEAQRVSAEADYIAAQTALEAYLQISQIEALQLKLDELNVLYNGQSSDYLLQYSYYLARKNNMLALEIQAEALKAQLEKGTESTAGDLGDALAIFYARATALKPATNFQNNTSSSVAGANPSSLSEQVFTEPMFTIEITNLETLGDTSASYLADLDVLIAQAKAEQELAEAALDNLSRAVLDNGRSPVTEEVLTKLRQVKAGLESELAQYTELKNTRDIAWTAYQALQTKEAEIKNAPKESNYVVLVNPAITPVEPAPRGTLQNTLIGGAALFFIAAMAIVANVWWQAADVFGASQEKQAKQAAP
ncbi:MAG: Wzz/FepE/Etk N-terminal domain-containing protein [Chloroflexota bacterium]